MATVLYLETNAAGKVTHQRLEKDSVTVGRDPECDIVIDDKTLSRRHLKITVSGGSLLVQDLESRNGLTVDEKRVTKATLPIGSTFLAGSVLFTVGEAVSLSSLDSASASVSQSANSGSQEASPSITSSVSPSSASYAGSPDILTFLQDALRDTASMGELQHRLLGFLAESLNAETVALLTVVEGECCLASIWGPPLDRDAEEVLCRRAASETPEQRIEVDRLLGVRLSAGLPDLGWIVVDPAPANDVLPEGFEILAAMAGLCGLPGAKSEPVASAPDDEAGVKRTGSPPFITVSQSGRELLDAVDRLAPTDTPVLIQGPTGAGKEPIARRVHYRSRRAPGPFVAVDCPGTAASMFESQLFGITKGAATGVEPSPGMVQSACGGTLFLDEVADLPLEIQPKLLRAIDPGHVQMVGSVTPIPVNIRVVAATHQDLEARVKEGKFREDLYHRLAGSTVRIPPLRDRWEDILVLSRWFLDGMDGFPPGWFHLDRRTAALLLGYPWPGNVRELKNVLKVAAEECKGRVIRPSHLPDKIGDRADRTVGDLRLLLNSPLRVAITAFESAYFTHLTHRAGGNMSRASRLAGISRAHLYTKLKELGVKRP